MAIGWNRAPVLRGFIINKALFSVDEHVFPQQLSRLYGAEPFGVIPADRNAIQAYQQKAIPLITAADSDFSHYTVHALERLLSPTDNWRDETGNEEPEVEQFRKFAGRIDRDWGCRAKVENLTVFIPMIHVAAVVIAVTCYLFYQHAFDGTWFAFLSIALLAVILLPGPGLSPAAFAAIRASVQANTTKGCPHAARRAAPAAYALALWLGLAILALGAPRTFSQDPLRIRVSSQGSTISSLSDSLRAINNSVSGVLTELATLRSDKERLTASQERLDSALASAQRQTEEQAVRASECRPKPQSWRTPCGSARTENVPWARS